jgi:hypothetical protein
MAKVAERSQVAGDSKISEVPQQLALECCPLLANWFMSVLATPVRDALESAPKAVRGGQAARVGEEAVEVKSE